MRNTKKILSLLSILLILLLVSTAVAFAEGEADAEAPSRFYQSFWSLLPAIIAIGLALITKEVYTSLFVGILVGGLLYSDFSFEGTLTHIFNDGVVASLADSYNVGILIFLVILGILVILMNKAGGSAAFGRWAAAHIKTRAGAQLATIALGVLIAAVMCLIFSDGMQNTLAEIAPWLDLSSLFAVLNPAVVIVVGVFALTAFYAYLPAGKRRFISQLPGAVLAALGCGVLSFGFRVYVDHFSNYTVLYGSIGTVALLLVWMYLMAYILIAGGFVNHLFSERRHSRLL